MGLRVYRHLNGLDCETNETKVVSAMPLLIGENIHSMDFQIKVATVDNEHPISRWTPFNYAVMLVSDSIAMIYREDDPAVYEADTNAAQMVNGVGWSPSGLSLLFRNLMNRQDSEGHMWYGGSLQHSPIAPMGARGGLADQIGSGQDLVQDSDEAAAGSEQSYETSAYQIDAGFATYGPRIVVPLREEILMDRTVVVDGSANARAEYVAHHRIPIKGGFGAHGGIVLIGVWREEVSGENQNTDRFLIDSEHGSTNFSLAVGWSDAMRTQEIAKNSGTAAGAWFRQLWAGDNYTANNNVFTTDKVNVAVKGRIYVDTPYEIVGTH